MVFSVKYTVSEEDRHKLVDGSYRVDSDDATFRELAEALAAIYEQNTQEAVEFSKIYFVKKEQGANKMQEVTAGFLDASLTYDLMSDDIWVVVKRLARRASMEQSRPTQGVEGKTIYSVKYEVSKEDRRNVVDGTYEVKSDDVTFQGLADALVAVYHKATDENVEFSKLYLVEKQAKEDKTFQVADESLNGSLTYDLMSDAVWVVVKPR